MIEVLKKEVVELEMQLEAKRSELLMAMKYELKILGEKFPLKSFVGQMYMFDKPFKWTNPKNDTLTEEKANHFDYLWFNGIVSGKDINTLYSEMFYNSSISVAKDEQQFAIFVIPDEDFEGNKNDIVPLERIHELLMFKV